MLHLIEERLVFSLPFAGKNNQGLKKNRKITKPSGSGSANWLLITLETKIMVIGTSGKNLSLICTLWGKKILAQWEEGFVSLKSMADC